jgi:hypothetical protein
MALEIFPQGDSKNLETTLRERICSVCIDRSLEGACQQEKDQECALFRSFPQIVRAVTSVQSDRIDDYVAAIRQAVCAECVHQDEFGVCRVREEVRCVLDRYLLLIVQTIEEVRGINLTKTEAFKLAAG